MALSRLAQRTRAFAARHELLPANSRVLVAVSGGADSVALLLVLHELAPLLKLRLTVGHLDHGLRGKDAREDASFTRRLAGELNIPLREGRSAVRRIAARRGISLEMAAREARYRFLTRAARKAGATVIATAHTADDQAETILLKLARGTGPRGLCGIPVTTRHNAIPVARPLLSATRKEIERYLHRRNQPWREDETNRDPRHRRNRVRHEVLPFLADRLNPRIRESLVRLADILREEDEWMESMTAELSAGCTMAGALCAGRLATLPRAARRRFLLRFARDRGIPPSAVDFDLVERLDRLLSPGARPATVHLHGPWRAVRSGPLLRIEHGDAPPAKAGGRRRLRVPGLTRLPSWGLAVDIRVAPGLTRQAGRLPCVLPAAATLAPAPLGRRALYIRPWQPGDRMRPFGMQGSKKLQDIFTDAKVEASARTGLPILATNREIVWIPGYRVARGWEVEDPSKPSLQIQVAPLETNRLHRRGGVRTLHRLT